jgi:glucose-1-phosphate thymidylyltransferase
MIKRALLLAGGRATRLYPITKVCSKQLLPLYKKPVIAYPLQTLKEMGFEDILIITANEEQEKLFKELLKDGKHLGLNLSYKVQGEPRGLADAFIVGEDFIKDADMVAMILGDNVIIGENNFDHITPNTIYTYKVNDPSQYGVVVTDDDGSIKNIVEKPKEFVSNDAVIGLYVFSNTVVEMAKKVKPSPRGELEIVDLIKLMNEEEGVDVQPLNGFWFDVGDFNSLLDCANLVRTIDNRANHSIGIDNL